MFKRKKITKVSDTEVLIEDAEMTTEEKVEKIINDVDGMEDRIVNKILDAMKKKEDKDDDFYDEDEDEMTEEEKKKKKKEMEDSDWLHSKDPRIKEFINKTRGVKSGEELKKIASKMGYKLREEDLKRFKLSPKTEFTVTTGKSYVQGEGGSPKQFRFRVADSDYIEGQEINDHLVNPKINKIEDERFNDEQKMQQVMNGKMTWDEAFGKEGK